MDVPLYDVYLTGKLADDVSPALAAQRLAALFKSTPEAMAGLITGKTQLLKRGVDKNTAVKYRDTLQKAGCEVAFKAQQIAPSDSAAAKPAFAQPAASIPTQPATAPAAATSGLQLAPAGNLLRPEERHHVEVTNVNTAHLSVAPLGPLPAAVQPDAVAPDIGHLSLAPSGGNLIDEAELPIVPGIVPDTSDLSVAPVGAPIETLKEKVTLLNPDTSGLALTPAGGDLLTEAERHRPAPAAPNTDHIQLEP